MSAAVETSAAPPTRTLTAAATANTTQAMAVVPADPGPIQSAILAAQAYIYGYPLM